MRLLMTRMRSSWRWQRSWETSLTMSEAQTTFMCWFLCSRTWLLSRRLLSETRSTLCHLWPPSFCNQADLLPFFVVLFPIFCRLWNRWTKCAPSSTRPPLPSTSFPLFSSCLLATSSPQGPQDADFTLAATSAPVLPRRSWKCNCPSLFSIFFFFFAHNSLCSNAAHSQSSAMTRPRWSGGQLPQTWR